MCVSAVDVLDVDVAEGWGSDIHRLCLDIVHLLAAFQYLNHRFSSVVEVESDGIALDVKHGDIVDENVFHYATTSTATLETQTYIGAEELTIRHMDILHATTHLRTYHKAAMACKHSTTVHHHILTRFATLSAVRVLATLDADAIVASIELAIHDKRILARFQVEGITVLCIAWIAGKHTIDNDILAHEWMNVPSRRILENHTLQQHILATHQTYHHRAKETLDAVPFLFAFQVARYVHLSRFLTLGIALGRQPKVVAFENASLACHAFPHTISHFLLLQRTPIESVAVDSTFTRNGDVLGSIGRDRRLTATCVQSLERSLDKWVKGFVRSKEDDGTLL